MAEETATNDDNGYRLIMITKHIDSEMSEDIIKRITEYNFDDEKKSKTVVDFKPVPIKIHVNTYGGSVLETIAICGAIRLSKTPVEGYCLGKAMSGGLYIYSSCHKRYATKQSVFVYHEMSTFSGGKLEDIKQMSITDDELQDIIDDQLLERTCIKRKRLEEVRKERKDWYFYGEEAKNLGIVDELI